MLFMRKTTALPSAAEALPGRAQPIPTATSHFVNGRQLQPPYPAGLEQAVFGLGCFWGAERKFWELGDGIYTTAVGYAGGHTANPDLRRGLFGPHRPHRSGAGGVRSEADLLRSAAEDILGKPQPDAGHASGQRRRHPVSFRDLQPSATRSAKRWTRRRRPIKRRCRPRVSAPSPPRSRRQANSISPRTTTSNIWPRIRPAIADLAAPGCPVRSAPASAPDRIGWHSARQKRFVNHNRCKTGAVSL